MDIIYSKIFEQIDKEEEDYLSNLTLFEKPEVYAYMEEDLPGTVSAFVLLKILKQHFEFGEGTDLNEAFEYLPLLSQTTPPRKALTYILKNLDLFLTEALYSATDREVVTRHGFLTSRHSVYFCLKSKTLTKLLKCIISIFYRVREEVFKPIVVTEIDIREKTRQLREEEQKKLAKNLQDEKYISYEDACREVEPLLVSIVADEEKMLKVKRRKNIEDTVFYSKMFDLIFRKIYGQYRTKDYDYIFLKIRDTHRNIDKRINYDKLYDTCGKIANFKLSTQEFLVKHGTCNIRHYMNEYKAEGHMFERFIMETVDEKYIHIVLDLFKKDHEPEYNSLINIHSDKFKLLMKKYLQNFKSGEYHDIFTSLFFFFLCKTYIERVYEFVDWFDLFVCFDFDNLGKRTFNYRKYPCIVRYLPGLWGIAYSIDTISNRIYLGTVWDVFFLYRHILNVKFDSKIEISDKLGETRTYKFYKFLQ